MNINNELLFTTSYLSKKLGTDVNNLRYIRDNNNKLTSENIDIVKYSGFNSFYDLCISSIHSEQLSKGGNKDYSKLTAVEQTVVRNGKPTKMKIYVDKNKENSEDSNELDSKQHRSPMNATELTRGFSLGNLDEKTNPEKVAELKNEIDEWGVKQPITEDSYDYLEGRDETGTLRYLVGFSKKGKYITVDFYVTDGTISGDWLVAFYELIKLGLNYKLGVKYPNLKTRALYLIASEYNLVQKGSYLVASYEDLHEAVGDT